MRIVVVPLVLDLGDVVLCGGFVVLCNGIVDFIVLEIRVSAPIGE